MKIYFARHGETDWNKNGLLQGCTDIPLNETGREQARRLAESLADTDIGCVYCSPLGRARETARIVADRLGIPWVVCDGLQEYGLGVWEGKHWDEVKRDWGEVYAAWLADKRHTRVPEGETYEELLTRYVGRVMEIVRNADRPPLIVSHGGCMSAFQAELHRTPLEVMHLYYKAPNATAMAFDSEELLERWREC